MRRFSATDAEAYRQLARTWAATVNVVTACPHGDPLPNGFTATGFLTVSMDPPIILVSCANDGSGLPLLRNAEHFAVNLLAPHQDELASAFALPSAARANAWNAVTWAPDAHGAPLLAGTVGAFSARVREQLPAGDHTLVLGDVTTIHLSDAGEAETLVYHNRGYGRFNKAKT